MCAHMAVIFPSSFHQTEVYCSAESEKCSCPFDPLTLLTFKAADLLRLEGKTTSQSSERKSTDFTPSLSLSLALLPVSLLFFSKLFFITAHAEQTLFLRSSAAALHPPPWCSNLANIASPVLSALLGRSSSYSDLLFSYLLIWKGRGVCVCVWG